MCGRYYLSLDLGNLSFVDNISGYDFKDNFNISPQANVPVVIDNNLVNCTWGYYPQWLKDQSNSKPLFNTRFESLLEKKTFISAFKNSRCIVPISGWYELKVIDDAKQPFSTMITKICLPLVCTEEIRWNYRADDHNNFCTDRN